MKSHLLAPSGDFEEMSIPEVGRVGSEERVREDRSVQRKVRQPARLDSGVCGRAVGR